MQVKVPVMCSLASSNVVILPEDTVENLDCWMPESVDLFDDHLNIPELKSGFINQYDIEGNISDDSSFLSENETHCLYFGQHVWRSDHASVGAKRNEEIPRSGFDSDGWTEHSIYTIAEELRQLPENTVILVGTWRVDMNEGYFMRNATYAMMEATLPFRLLPLHR